MFDKIIHSLTVTIYTMKLIFKCLITPILLILLLLVTIGDDIWADYQKHIINKERS